MYIVDNRKHTQEKPIHPEKTDKSLATNIFEQKNIADQEETTCGSNIWSFFSWARSYLGRMRRDFNDIMSKPSNGDDPSDIGLGY